MYKKPRLIPHPKLLHLFGGSFPLARDMGSSPPKIADSVREGIMDSDLVGRVEAFGLPIQVEKRSPGNVLSALKRGALSAVADVDGTSALVGPEAYSVQISAAGAVVCASTFTGRMHGIHTLAQFIWNYLPQGNLPYASILDWPSLPVRGIHVCYHLVTEFMSGMAPNLQELLRRIRLLRHYKGNLLLLELESLFPYEAHPKVSCEMAFKRSELGQVAGLCHEHGVEMLPLIQCLGHAYNVLRHPEYAHLREVPGTTQQYCPSVPAVRDFYLELVDEIQEVFPQIRGIHVGGDESRRLGLCERCRDKARREGVAALYGEHVGEICQRLLGRGLTPYVWADMMEHMPDVGKYLPQGTVLVYWNYDILSWSRKPAFDLFKQSGLDIVTASGARFGTHNHTMYRYSDAMSGIGVLTRETERQGLSGTLVTDWVKAVPHEFSCISLFYGLSEGWNAAGSQADYEQAFARLHFGLPEEMTASLAKIYRLLEPPVPFCEDAQAHLIDRLDRYDRSGLGIGERIARYTAQDKSSEHWEALRSALERGQEALSIADELLPKCGLNERELEILRLSAKTQIHKARMGIAFMEAARALRYPMPNDEPVRQRLIAEFQELIGEWSALAEETRALLLAGTFPESVEHTVEIKFEPGAKAYMERFLDLLRRGETVVHLLA